MDSNGREGKGGREGGREGGEGEGGGEGEREGREEGGRMRKNKGMRESEKT